MTKAEKEILARRDRQIEALEAARERSDSEWREMYYELQDARKKVSELCNSLDIAKQGIDDLQKRNTELLERARRAEETIDVQATIIRTLGRML